MLSKSQDLSIVYFRYGPHLYWPEASDAPSLEHASTFNRCLRLAGDWFRAFPTILATPLPVFDHRFLSKIHGTV